MVVPPPEALTGQEKNERREKRKTVGSRRRAVGGEKKVRKMKEERSVWSWRVEELLRCAGTSASSSLRLLSVVASLARSLLQ